jgi:hypothetical protein
LQMDGMAKMEQVKQADKKIQMDALAKAGQLKQDKARQEFENKKLQVDALNKAGQHKMQKAQLANQATQQKEKPEQ